ncbi:hypothetical protein SBOR_3978 [Sclerotinia borealis F-4128]|uniref:Uncharacterized protein n=1 Tax=Sclerotinia borealis (strain F-4128) TaxID=1432307 RepID=W9CM73_SCLBF|nr:hypothetical protein SBOR_3978 [Sclerotinia borealis F-4128]
MQQHRSRDERESFKEIIFSNTLRLARLGFSNRPSILDLIEANLASPRLPTFQQLHLHLRLSVPTAGYFMNNPCSVHRNCDRWNLNRRYGPGACPRIRYLICSGPAWPANPNCQISPKNTIEDPAKQPQQAENIQLISQPSFADASDHAFDQVVAGALHADQDNPGESQMNSPSTALGYVVQLHTLTVMRHAPAWATCWELEVIDDNIACTGDLENKNALDGLYHSRSIFVLRIYEEVIISGGYFMSIIPLAVICIAVNLLHDPANRIGNEKARLQSSKRISGMKWLFQVKMGFLRSQIIDYNNCFNHKRDFVHQGAVKSTVRLFRREYIGIDSRYKSKYDAAYDFGRIDMNLPSVDLRRRVSYHPARMWHSRRLASDEMHP